jgi:hypothetical protein
MTRFRLVVALAVCAAVAAATAGRAGAWATCAPVGASEVQSAHFNIFYTTDPTQAQAITNAQAGDLAAFGEQAYAAYAALGFPTPVDDGSGKIEISVVAPPSPQTWSYLPCHGSAQVNFKMIGAASEALVMGTLTFEASEMRTWDPSHWSDFWLFEGAGAWAWSKSLGYPQSAVNDLGPSEVSLDCSDPGEIGCSKNEFENLGLTRWPFYEYLAQRFGTNFITTVLHYGASAGVALQGLKDGLSTYKQTLPDVFNDFVVREMTGGWGITSLDSVVPTVSGPPLFTGAATADLGSRVVSVDHLAARYVEFDRGDGSAGHPCFAASLTINVALPAGVGSRPYFFWNVKGSSPVALSISGNTATTTVPWDTCLWPTNRGYLALPNPSTTVNSANYTITSHLTVDTSAQVNVIGPPSPVSIWGQVVPVPTADVVPSIQVFGPELIRVSAKDRLIRLIVQSSGPGAVQATLGSVLLGNSQLRAGNNDLRFAVPKGLVASLRRAASAANTLSLTPVASTGATGQPVTRLITITPAQTKKKK